MFCLIVATTDADQLALVAPKRSAFKIMEEQMKRDGPISIFMMPEVVMGPDDRPYSPKAKDFLVFEYREGISKFCKLFLESKTEINKWPETKGREYKLVMVFRGAKPMVCFRVFKNIDGWFLISQWNDEKSGDKISSVYLAGKELVQEIENNLVKFNK